MKRKTWRFDRDGFWRAIAGRMEADGLTFRTAAKASGVSPATLYRIQAHACDIDTLVAARIYWTHHQRGCMMGGV